MNRTFLDVLCGATHLVRRVLQTVVVLLLLLGFSFLFVAPGTGSYYIAIVNAIILVPLLVASMTIIYWCESKRERKTIDAVELTHDDESDRDDGGGRS